MTETVTVDYAIYGRPQHEATDPVRPSEFYGEAQHEECESAFGPLACTDPYQSR